jgi:hypothetical protein
MFLLCSDVNLTVAADVREEGEEELNNSVYTSPGIRVITLGTIRRWKHTACIRI